MKFEWKIYSVFTFLTTTQRKINRKVFSYREMFMLTATLHKYIIQFDMNIK